MYNELENHLEGSGRGLMDLISQHLFGGTDENHDKFRSEYIYIYLIYKILVYIYIYMCVCVCVCVCLSCEPKNKQQLFP
jgi:hypothetical protein